MKTTPQKTGGREAPVRCAFDIGWARQGAW